MSHARSSILREPDVLELLVRAEIGRGHVVLHLGPVHDPARPPETRQVVGIAQHALLELDDGLLPLGGGASPRPPPGQTARIRRVGWAPNRWMPPAITVEN